MSSWRLIGPSEHWQIQGELSEFARLPTHLRQNYFIFMGNFQTNQVKIRNCEIKCPFVNLIPYQVCYAMQVALPLHHRCILRRTFMNRIFISSWVENENIFYAPNFEKVGSILVSACMYVSVCPLCFSRYRFETSRMDSSWKNRRHVCCFYGIISPFKITALWKKSWCNFVSAVPQKVFEVESWNLCQLIEDDE